MHASDDISDAGKTHFKNESKEAEEIMKRVCKTLNLRSHLSDAFAREIYGPVDIEVPTRITPALYTHSFADRSPLYVALLFAGP